MREFDPARDCPLDQHPDYQHLFDDRFDQFGNPKIDDPYEDVDLGSTMSEDSLGFIDQGPYHPNKDIIINTIVSRWQEDDQDFMEALNRFGGSARLHAEELIRFDLADEYLNSDKERQGELLTKVVEESPAFDFD